MSGKSPIGRVDYVIGDVHGCFAELSDLIVKICEDAWGDKGDIHLWFIGDLIDKGPKSEAVLESVLLDQKPRIVKHSILGNHEEKMIRWCRAQARQESGGARNEIVDRWNFSAIRDYADLLSTLPLYAYLPDYNVLLVHGGIEPKMTELPPVSLDKASKSQKNILRVRYVSPEGKMVSLGAEDLEQGDKWWADLYDGRFGTAIYGHQPYEEVVYHPHAIGIDTGCVYGNKLTALRLSLDGKHTLIQVDAKKKYAKSYDEE